MIYFYLIIFLFVSIFFKIPILAIFGGIIFSLIFKTKNEFITFEKAYNRAKERQMYLDKIRKQDITKIFSKDKRILDWWKNI